MSPTQITYQDGNEITLEIPEVKKGDIKNIRIDGKAVNSKQTLTWVLFFLSLAILVFNLLIYLKISTETKDMKVVTSSIEKVLAESSGRIRYMIDVKPSAREYKPYQEYQKVGNNTSPKP
jgi:hypothetical protein